MKHYNSPVNGLAIYENQTLANLHFLRGEIKARHSLVGGEFILEHPTMLPTGGFVRVIWLRGECTPSGGHFGNLENPTGT